MTYGYFYDAEDIVLERKAVQVGAGTPVVTDTQYVHGPGIDEPLAMVRNGQSYYYHADGLGSIVAITDSQKNIVQRYSYDSFGMATPSNPEFENSYMFTGREWDKEVGLYYYRARYYDPMEGRFVSKDPIGFAGGDVNLYGYVWNGPANWVDPSGEPLAMGVSQLDTPIPGPMDVIAGAIITGAWLWDNPPVYNAKVKDGEACERPKPYEGETPDDVPEKFRPSGSPGRQKKDDGSVWEKDRDQHGGSKWKRWPNEKDADKNRNKESVRPDGSVR